LQLVPVSLHELLPCRDGIEEAGSRSERGRGLGTEPGLLLKMKGKLGAAGILLASTLFLSAAEPWSLERAIQFALTNNPEARISAKRIVSAQAALAEANAAFWPKLQFQSSYTRTDNPMLAFGSILNQRSYSGSLDFNDVPDVD